MPMNLTAEVRSHHRRLAKEACLEHAAHKDYVGTYGAGEF